VLELTEFRFPSELGLFRRVPLPLEPTRLFFQLTFNLTFFHHLYRPSSFPIPSLIFISKWPTQRRVNLPRTLLVCFSACVLSFNVTDLACNQPTSSWEVSLPYVLSSSLTSYSTDMNSLGCRQDIRSPYRAYQAPGSEPG